MDGCKLGLLFEKQKKKALYFSHPLQIKVRKKPTESSVSIGIMLLVQKCLGLNVDQC